MYKYCEICRIDTEQCDDACLECLMRDIDRDDTDYTDIEFNDILKQTNYEESQD